MTNRLIDPQVTKDIDTYIKRAEQLHNESLRCAFTRKAQLLAAQSLAASTLALALMERNHD